MTVDYSLSPLEFELYSTVCKKKDGLFKFLNGDSVPGLSNIKSKVLEIGSRLDEEEKWGEFLVAARSHIKMALAEGKQIETAESGFECIPADDAYYFPQDQFDAKLRAKEIVVELAQEKREHSNKKEKDIMGGMGYLFMELETMVSDHNTLKELKSLLFESRPSKSKWASEDKVGQEPLYEALEKVIIELKNYTEHSIPFLKPVQKREAPNYYDVIKNPMDLGTMLKKLKNFEYKSKDEFWKDLDLIWNNCLTYNTLPDSIYRKHANCMKKRADDCMKLVPDILVKVGDDSDDDEGTATQSLNGDMSVDTTNTRRPLSVAVVAEEQDPTEIDFNEGLESATDSLKADFPKESDDVTNEDQDDEDDDPLSTDSLWESMYYKKWRRVSLEQRAHIYKRHFLEAGIKFENRSAFVRTPEGMQDFCEQESQYLQREKLLNMDASTIMIQSHDWEKAFLPELMPPTCILPHLKQPQQLDCPVGSLSKVSSAVADKSSHIYRKIYQNIFDLQEIKRISYQMEGDTYPSRGYFSSSQSTAKTVLPNVNLGKIEADILLKKAIGELLSHAGFDSIYSTALCVFADLVVQYISKFGVSLRLCLDSVSKDVSPEDILSYALRQNGIKNLNGMHSYILQLVSQGKKLSKLKNQISQVYSRQLLAKQKSLEISQEDENELIMSGNYMSSLGIDLLNLKGIGINCFNVPLELWNKNAPKPIIFEQDQLSSPLTPSRLKEISPWDPIMPDQQIGLLKAFYQRPPEALIEDEHKPNAKSLKSKLMVKTAMAKRRLIIGTDAPKKKKKT